MNPAPLSLELESVSRNILDDFSLLSVVAFSLRNRFQLHLLFYLFLRKQKCILNIEKFIRKKTKISER